MALELVTSKATPPGGVVTLELKSANTGRTLKKVSVENALMGWYESRITQNANRGWKHSGEANWGSVNYSTEFQGFDPLTVFAAARPEFQEAAYAGFTKGRTNWFPFSPALSAYWLWATDSSAAVDTSALEIPVTGGAASLGEVTAGADLVETFAADGIQNKRGTVTPGACSWTWAQQRVQVDFASSVGNGVYRSIGLGSLEPQRIAPGGLRANRPALHSFSVARNYNFQLYLGVGLYGERFSIGRPGSNAIWAVQENGLNIAYWDVDDPDYSSFTSTYGGTSTPPGTGANTVCVDTASDFWVLRNGQLYRCDTRPPATLNVVNTYDLTGSLASPTSHFLDMCFDGTDLRIVDSVNVHTVSTTTGAVTSSWAHGITDPGTPSPKFSIVWNAVTSELYVNWWAGNTAGPDEGWGKYAQIGQFSIRGPADSAVIHRFTSAGTKVGALMGIQTSPYTDEQSPHAQICLMDADGVMSGSTGQYDFSIRRLGMHGPSMATHALLGADLTKTDSETLTVTYDFNYA